MLKSSSNNFECIKQLEMDISCLCRVCLTENIKMHVITNTRLHELYEKLAETKLEPADGKPTMLCYICFGQLRSCLGFMRLAQRTETTLTELCQSGVEWTPELLLMIKRPVHTYSVTPVECVDIFNGANEAAIEQANQNIKKELLEDKDLDIKDNITETQADFIKQDPDCEPADDAPVDFQSDSEDDLPLKSLKTEVKKEQQKRIYRKGRKLDVSEVLLTREQQLQDVVSRASSLNYLNSPYRCALCYREFVTHMAYANHKDKHDERVGPFECEYCKLRYQSGRLLRSHTHTAHARYYKCNKCSHLSHTVHQASDHERWHEGHTYRCQLCGQSFVKRTSYLTHVRKRHPSDHVCAACGERFVGRHGLLMHISKTHKRRDEEPEESSPAADRFCSTCNIQFMTSRAWQRHILTSVKHTEQAEQTGQCPICSACVGSCVPEHLAAHARALRVRARAHARGHAPRTHPAAQPLACGQCGQTFLNKGNLAAHVRRAHLGLKYNKNIVCEVCGKKCTSNAALKYHQRTHTGERPYKCVSCAKRFADKNQLRIHTRTHTGEKPYSCEHCDKRFAQKPALNRHYRVHTGAKPYECSLCSKSFSQSNSLKGHVRSVHLKMPSTRRKGRNNPDITQVGKDVQNTSFEKAQELVLNQE